MKSVRIEFSKIGRARYISHLDLMRTMTRALRRADIPLWYTEGFNRHPYITFAAPLSLGYEGLCETMDLRLTEELPYEELVSRLDAAMPEGLHVVNAYEAVMKPGALTSARYRLAFACPAAPLEALLAQETISVEKRTKKGGTKSIDIRPLLSDILLEETGDGCTLTVTLPCNSSETVNPALLATALEASVGASITFTVTRLTLFGPQGERFA